MKGKAEHTLAGVYILHILGFDLRDTESMFRVISAKVIEERHVFYEELFGLSAHDVCVWGPVVGLKSSSFPPKWSFKVPLPWHL